MSRPRLLDLFAGAQGAGVGYARAGFEVHAVDIAEHARHPEVASFTAADAMDVLADVEYCRTFDVIHTSPPCQAMTTMSNRYRGAGGRADQHVNLIPAVRRHLHTVGRPYVIENVPGAAEFLRQPLLIHGGMFGLRVYRPRLFECNRFVMSWRANPPLNPIGVYGARPDGRRLWTREDGSEQLAAHSIEQARDVMGIEWMDWPELVEAIPPAYTQHIGDMLLATIGQERVAS